MKAPVCVPSAGYIKYSPRNQKESKWLSDFQIYKNEFVYFRLVKTFLNLDEIKFLFLAYSRIYFLINPSDGSVIRVISPQSGAQRSFRLIFILCTH